MNKEAKQKNIVQLLMKAIFVFCLLCIVLFIILSVSSYFWLEGLKLEMDDMMSFDQFEETTQE
ncbi:MAG: hypothetical protein ACLFU1_03735 [Alphaproteobacteria bacterium]